MRIQIEDFRTKKKYHLPRPQSPNRKRKDSNQRRSKEHKQVWRKLTVEMKSIQNANGADQLKRLHAKSFEMGAEKALTIVGKEPFHHEKIDSCENGDGCQRNPVWNLQLWYENNE